MFTLVNRAGKMGVVHLEKDRSANHCFPPKALFILPLVRIILFSIVLSAVEVKGPILQMFFRILFISFLAALYDISLC